jgi:hypothetical protein
MVREPLIGIVENWKRLDLASERQTLVDGSGDVRRRTAPRVPVVCDLPKISLERWCSLSESWIVKAYHSTLPLRRKDEHRE